MREINLSHVGVRRRGGRHDMVGELEQLLDLPLHDDAVLVGLGPRGLTVAMAMAAALGRDLAFVRSDQKDHGTGRVLDGCEVGGRPIAVISHPQDTGLLSLVPHQAELLAFLEEPRDRAPATWPDGLVPPDAPRVRPTDALEYLEGSFTTSSGREVQRYVETLKACFRYDVALEFARRLKLTASAVSHHSAIAHGGALLAAVAAATQGSVASLFNVGQADGSLQFDSPTCFVDDYVGLGNAQRAACLAVAGPHRATSHFIAVYGPAPTVDFGEQKARVLVVTGDA